MLPKTNRDLRILVVDDIESMRKLVIRNLNQMGYMHIVQAANGQEALRQLESNPTIQMVVTDWNMPVMSGIDLLRAIRAHERFNQIPVLMITAEIARHQVQESAEAGVSAFLVKPFTVGGLQAKVDKVLAKLAKGQVTSSEAELMCGAGAAPFAGALFTKRPPAAPTGSANPASQSALSRPLAQQPASGAEPLALVITEDLQARMTRQANLLVVDDISDNIDVLVGLLQDEYKVRAAKSGEAALRMLAGGQNLPDLILLDVMMPDMDGFEVCRRLKANPATAGIPIIFLTAADDAQNVVQGLELGAVDYVTKPANPTVLKVRVRNHLTRSKAFAELQNQYAVLEENARLHEEVERMTRHDLKNPIGGIMNFTDLLLSDDMMTKDQKDMLQTINDSARSLLGMVNLSLDLFKIEQGTYELQPSPVDLISVVRRVLNEKGAEINAKKLHVSTTLRRTGEHKDQAIEFFVIADDLLCYSMFANLIKNAAEAAPNEGKLAITLGLGESGMGEVQITNSGTVPEAIRDSFFEKYSTSGKSGGTGIGTYSAKLIAEAQGGALEMATSDAENETTLTVRLPLGE